MNSTLNTFNFFLLIDQVVYIPLSAQAKKWLSEYDENEEFVFPDANNRSLNMKIAKWAKSAGISKHNPSLCKTYLRYHDADTRCRHLYRVKTFGTHQCQDRPDLCKDCHKKKDDAVCLVDSIFD